MSLKIRFNSDAILKEFDEFLAGKKKTFKAVMTGSGAMNMLGLLDRPTVDLDILNPKIPREILELAEEFRQKMVAQGKPLEPNWFNDATSAFLEHFPKDWAKRTQPLFKGKALDLSTLGRGDLLKDKLWGYCDARSHDKTALLNLKPTKEELLQASDWVKKARPKEPLWPGLVEDKVEELLKVLGYGN